MYVWYFYCPKVGWNTGCTIVPLPDAKASESSWFFPTWENFLAQGVL